MDDQNARFFLIFNAVMVGMLVSNKNYLIFIFENLTVFVFDPHILVFVLFAYFNISLIKARKLQDFLFFSFYLFLEFQKTLPQICELLEVGERFHAWCNTWFIH